jgi:hypothetical protein
VLRLGAEDGTPELTGYVLCFTARAHYLAGDAGRALACARQADTISRALVEHLGLAARVHLASAHAHLADGRAGDAVESARSALDLLQRTDKARAGEAATTLAAALLERRPSPPPCEWRAELANVLGDDATRKQLLQEARRGYDEIGAPGHAGRIRRQLSIDGQQRDG